MGMLFQGQASPRQQLTIELVPKGCWFRNLRAVLVKDDWDQVRKQAYREAGYQCEICGGRGDKWPVECHEVWEYDERESIQRLTRLSALCPDCHHVKHWGYAHKKGNTQECYNHIEFVNGWNHDQAQQHVREEFERWVKRSEIEWGFDITALSRYGIDMEALRDHLQEQGKDIATQEDHDYDALIPIEDLI